MFQIRGMCAPAIEETIARTPRAIAEVAMFLNKKV